MIVAQQRHAQSAPGGDVPELLPAEAGVPAALGTPPSGDSTSGTLPGGSFANSRATPHSDTPRPGSLIDSHGRMLRDLRVSITDRCNFRCLYCLPETEAAHNFYRGHWAHVPDAPPILQQWVPKSAILSFEEIERVVRLAADLGIEKIRLTGGEPLLRQGVEKLAGGIAGSPASVA